MRLYDGQSGGTIDRARKLRRNAPEPERRLLRALREAFPHLKWRHQVPVGSFFADILCFSEKLVIEIDGDTHAQSAGYDAGRTALIVREGYRVLRFANSDVTTNLEGVLVQTSLWLRTKDGAWKDEGEQARKKGAPAGTGTPSPFRRYAAPSLSHREREK